MLKRKYTTQEKIQKKIRFSLLDYANAFGVPYHTMRGYSTDKMFDPYDIKSVCEFYIYIKQKKEIDIKQNDLIKLQEMFLPKKKKKK